MKLEITFKSGTTVIVDVESWEVNHTPTGGRTLTWGSKKGRQLVDVKMEDVVCIVECK